MMNIVILKPLALDLTNTILTLGIAVNAINKYLNRADLLKILLTNNLYL